MNAYYRGYYILKYGNTYSYFSIYNGKTELSYFETKRQARYFIRRYLIKHKPLRKKPQNLVKGYDYILKDKSIEKENFQID